MPLQLPKIISYAGVAIHRPIFIFTFNRKGRCVLNWCLTLEMDCMVANNLKQDKTEVLLVSSSSD